MNRRDFLGSLGGAGAVRVLVQMSDVIAAAPDDLCYRGWHVRWSGWRTAVDQDFVHGFWTAWRGSDLASGWASSTTGTVQLMNHPFDRIATCHMDDWPMPTAAGLDTDEKRDAVRRRALHELIRVLS